MLTRRSACLAVWDAKEAHPDWPNFLLNDYVDGVLSETEIEQRLASRDAKDSQRAGGDASQRVEKTYAVSRDYRIAQQYIDNVALGFFPKRSTR